MQSYSINIPPVAASEFEAAVDAAIPAQAASLDDVVKAVIHKLGETTKLMAGHLTDATHIGAYIAGNHASGTENTALREGTSIQIYAAPPPPPPAAVDSVTQAPTEAAQPGALITPPGGSPLSESPPTPAEPDNPSAGASPIPTALEPSNTVPDGSAPVEGTPPEQVDPSAPSSDEPAPADAAPSEPVVVTEPAPDPAAPLPPPTEPPAV